MGKTQTKKLENLSTRPPIVVVLGHVDHGKTTLLDRIRKSNVVARESGGITQHIGAYQIEHQGKKITFIDTPGHEAFSQMRSRGAKVADIAILVIAAEEGVKPQTKEVVSYVKEEEIPTIIALNKIDKPQANPEKALGELANEELLTEERGGSVPAVRISAKDGTGIDELLEMIVLLAEMEDLKADTKNKANGVVIESNLDSKRGVITTMLVLDGTLEIGKWVVCGSCYGKIKGLEDYKGESIKKAEPSDPVVVLGLGSVPIVGEQFKITDSEEEARSLLKKPVENIKNIQSGDKSQSEKSGKQLNIVLKADVRGSLEAILESLENIDLEDVNLNIIKSEVGDISESDVKTAYPSDALIIGFNTKASKDVFNLAKRSGVKIKTYNVIYELFEEIKRQAAKFLEPEISKENLGKLKVLAIFRKEKSRMIVGGKVIEGKVVNKVLVDVFRTNTETGEEEKIASGRITQLQHNKNDMSEVEKGREAGLLYEGEPIIQEGDILEFYREEKKKREL